MQLAVGGGSGLTGPLTTANAAHNAHPMLPLHNTGPAPVRRRRASCSRDCVRSRAIEGLVDALTTMAPHLPLAYEPVALPCSMMQCGDIVHRSTLDPVLRGEITGPDWRTFALMATMGAYLFAPPGVLPGAFDYYVYAKLKNKTQTTYGKDDIILGRKLATGGFGTVFRGDLRLESGELVPVIVKKAKEFGEAEAWMNERMTRIGGDHCAEYVIAFDETDSNDSKKKKEVKKPSRGKVASPLDDAVWLVWKYEGDNTLWNLMESKEFPYNMEPLLFGRELRLPRGALRKAVTIRLVMKQLLEALAAAHGTGIVHRDIKPQNCIVSERDRKIKLIDLGAAADLRVGINYVPAEYLLDPRYAPPQQYVMSTQTPKPPPAPVAAFLSPVLWRMESPDRFDMYSCGVTFLQMVFPSLRNDNSIINFRKRLEVLKWDLRAWRAEEEARGRGLKADLAEGFELLDMDGGTGWELLCSLMAFKPADRPAASEALLSPFLSVAGATSAAGPVVSAVASTSQSLLSQAGKAVSRTLDNQLFADFASAATGEGRGALTEAQLRQELGLEEEAPKAPLTASNTIVWWKERQNELRKSIQKREGSQSTRPEGLPVAGSSGSARISKAAAAAGGRAGSPVLTRAAAAGSNGTGNNGNGKVRARSPPLVALFGGLGGSASGRNGKDGTTAIRALDSTDAGDESSEEEEEEEREVVMVGQRAGSKRSTPTRESSPGFDLLGMLRRK